MSWSERSVRNHKQQTDCAIHRAYVQLACDPAAFDKFQEVLYYARKRAPRLFESPVLNGRHPGVDALANLSRFSGLHIRPVTSWTGTASCWRLTVSSLAHHLVCKYKVPMFLASAWHANDWAADRKRGWFIAHSRGASLRLLNLPIEMTRRMEHLLLASPDHLQIEYAIRRAELLALKMPPSFLKAILSSRLSTDLRHSEFWRTVWSFLIENARDIDPEQIGPMIDYLHAIRHERVIVETPEGRVELDPPQPSFSMKGRTVQSMHRLMKDWHRSLGVGGAALSWVQSPFEPLVLEEQRLDRSEAPARWHMMELTNSAQLRAEGSALHHCVASYANRCSRGVSSIWSLRRWQGERVRHVLTVEIDPKKRVIVQARGMANRVASGKSLRLLQDWAVREKLRMAI